MRLWRISLLSWTAVLALGVAVLGAVIGRELPGASMALMIGAAGAALALRWPGARYRSWGFAVRESDVLLRYGVWWRTVSIVPHARIQHVDTTHGPLERALGLASVVIFTAGSVGAALTIPGLSVAEAEELRDRLAVLGRTGDAV